MTKREKRRTFCDDCLKNSDKCGKNPIECMQKEDAELYFRLYGEGIRSC